MELSELKNKIKSIAFDVDNVLVYSELLHTEAWEIVLSKHGIATKNIDFQSGIGLTDYEFAASIVPNSTSTEIQKILTEKWSKFLDIVRQKIKPQHNTSEVLDKLRIKYRLCTASSSNFEAVNLMLTLSGLVDKFEFLLTRENVTNHKPAPDIYRLAADRFGIIPVECLVVEDSPAGIVSAKTAGLYCVAITTSFGKDRLHQADIIINSLAELEKLV